MNTFTKAAVQGAACGLMIGLVLLVGWRVWHPGVAEVVRARSFEVVDAAGKTRASLNMMGEEPALILSDQEGKPRATLWRLGDGSGSLDFRDLAMVTRASLRVLSNGQSWLTLSDATGKERANVETSPDGNAGLTLSDAAGTVIWKAP